MDHVKSCISRLNKELLESPERVELALVAILNASGYSNGA